MTKNELKVLIKESLIKMINEGNFFMDDDQLKQEAQEKLQVAHKTLNNLLLTLMANSDQSEFAKNLFSQVKQVDDAILLTRKNF